MSETILLSICIPTYGRPRALQRALNSIEQIRDRSLIEIVICENDSPLQEETRLAVKAYKESSPYKVRYYENDLNLGFAGNLKQLIKHAEGKWIIFVGDDDEFVPGILEEYIQFLSNNSELGYVLRSYRTIDSKGGVIDTRYYKDNTFFSPCEETYIKLLRPSVYFAGITFQKQKFMSLCQIDYLKNSPYFQLYIVGELSLNHHSACFSKPIVQSAYFELTEEEQGIHNNESCLVEISVNQFMEVLDGYFDIVKYIDNKYNIKSLAAAKKNMSKYSYPWLTHFPYNSNEFRILDKRLRSYGLSSTIYYPIYKYGIKLLGVPRCNQLIGIIKKIIGKTPEL